MEYRIEVLASFKKEAKRLRKHYASFIDDYGKNYLASWNKNPRFGGPISATAFVRSVCVSLPKDEAKAVGQGLSLLRSGSHR